MSSFYEALGNHIYANIPALDSIIGDRVFPVQAPQGTAYPFCTYAQISDDADITHAGPSGWGSIRVQFDFYGKSLAHVHDAARAMRAHFEGKTVKVSAEKEACFCRVETEFDEYDSDEKVYRRVFDLLFEYNAT